ncbi:hypothetical protein IT418_00320 [bacterium]|nr:hypothetical protein [bacterium]
MQDFISALNEQLKAQITILFHHKTDGLLQQVADASYTLYLSSYTATDSVITLQLSNGMEGDARSDLTVSLPISSQFTKKNDTEWQVEYETASKTQNVRLLFTPKISAKSSQVKVETPSIKEFRDDEGKLARLYIETPEEGVNLTYLHKINSILGQLLGSWSNIIITTKNSDLDFTNEPVNYVTIELLPIPGNAFFELQVNTVKGDRTLEIATTLVIDLVKSRITFTLEEIEYQIAKVI